MLGYNVGKTTEFFQQDNLATALGFWLISSPIKNQSN